MDAVCQLMPCRYLVPFEFALLVLEQPDRLGATTPSSQTIVLEQIGIAQRYTVPRLIFPPPRLMCMLSVTLCYRDPS